MATAAPDEAEPTQRRDQAEFIGVAELARILGIGRNRCYELAAADRLPIPTIRINDRSYRFRRQAVERLGLADDRDRRG